MANAFALNYIPPFNDSDITAVTLAATNKALYPLSSFPTIGQLFEMKAKAYRISIEGRITTAATPGNLTLALFYGTGADANGVSICASAALALTASQTNLSFSAEFDVECRSTGSAGTLFGTGKAWFNNAVLASTLQPMMIPASAPAVSSACDLTSQSLILSVQALRSGSTAETMQLHKVRLIGLN